MKKLAIATVAAVLAVTPANATTGTGGGGTTTTQQEDRDFPWGLLGLLGLAGLLGRKRDDRDANRGTGTR